MLGCVSQVGRITGTGNGLSAVAAWIYPEASTLISGNLVTATGSVFGTAAAAGAAAASGGRVRRRSVGFDSSVYFGRFRGGGMDEEGTFFNAGAELCLEGRRFDALP